MNGSAFVHLRCHSHYSLGAALPSPRALARAAAAREMPALALTDFNSLAGACQFTQACREFGVQPILGADLSLLAFSAGPSAKKIFQLTLLAESEAGYRNLTRLVSAAQLRAARKNILAATLDELAESTTGLLCLIGGADSEIRELLANRDVEGATGHLQTLSGLFGREQIFFQLQTPEDRSARDANASLAELAEFLDLPAVAVQDIRYLRCEEQLPWMFLRNLEPPPIQNSNRWLGRTVHHFAQADELRGVFSGAPAALDVTRLIARRCRFVLQPGRGHGYAADFERGSDADLELWNLAFERAAAIYPNLDEKIKARLNEEFEAIKKANLSNYILLLRQITGWLDEQAMTRGIGQGNLVSSLIAYTLGLTQIDPLQHHIRFNETYLRDTATPILAIEVAERHADSILRFIQHEFGDHNVCYAGEFTLPDRRDLARRLCRWAGVSDKRQEATTAEILGQLQHDRRWSWKELFLNGPANLSIRNADVLTWLCLQLESCPQRLTARTGELLISGCALDYLLPREWRSGRIGTAQLPAEDCKQLGMPSLHVVVNSTLELQDQCVECIRGEYDENFHPGLIALDDPQVYRLFAAGLTAGIPGFDTATMKALLRSHRPGDLRELTRVKSMDPAPRPLARANFELLADIPNCLQACRCAWLKAHYPASFFCALFNSRAALPRVFLSALHELRRFNVRLQPLDVNLSDYQFTQNGEHIRAGLRIVKQLGEKAWSEIAKVRRGGSFTGLLDLCRRTDSRLIHYRLITNLILAGALDAFGHTRAQLLALLDKAFEIRRDSRIPAQDAESQTSSLFEELPHEPEAAAETALLPELPELPAADLLLKETLATGIALSQSPVASYPDLIRGSQLEYPPVLNPRLLNQDVWLAGLIDQLSTDFPAMEDDVEALLDFEGVLIFIPGRLLPAARQALKEQLPVLIGGRVYQKRETLFVKAGQLYELSRVRQYAGRITRVTLDLKQENRGTLRAVWRLMQRFPGATKIDPRNYPGRAGAWTLNNIRKHGVLFTPPFFYELGKILPPDRLQLTDVNEETAPWVYQPATAVPAEDTPQVTTEHLPPQTVFSHQ